MTKQKRNLQKEITQRFIDALENGCVPWIKPWKTDDTNGFPINATNERRYRGINIPILWSTAVSRGFKRDRWLSYRQAQKAGGHVRRGEKGTPVIFYRTIEVPKPDNKATQDDGPHVYKVARSYTLFNVEQCAGLPKKMKGVSEVSSAPSERMTQVDAMVRNTGVKIRHGGAVATYMPKADIICMPPAQAFRNSKHYYSTLLHEMCHWTGHKSRLKRPGIVEDNPFGSLAYAHEELIAEIGSAFLCAEYGIQGDLRHEGYVVDWIKEMKAKPSAIFHAAAAAQTAFQYLVQPANEKAA